MQGGKNFIQAGAAVDQMGLDPLPIQCTSGGIQVPSNLGG
jgi:hypothetical protein